MRRRRTAPYEDTSSEDTLVSEPEPFDKCTEQARKVLTLAQQEAQRFQNDRVGTEHLLLGLVIEGEGIAMQVLRSLAVDPQKLLRDTEFILGPSDGDRVVSGEIRRFQRST